MAQRWSEYYYLVSFHIVNRYYIVDFLTARNVAFFEHFEHFGRTSIEQLYLLDSSSKFSIEQHLLLDSNFRACSIEEPSLIADPADPTPEFGRSLRTFSSINRQSDMRGTSCDYSVRRISWCHPFYHSPAWLWL